MTPVALCLTSCIGQDGSVNCPLVDRVTRKWWPALVRCYLPTMTLQSDVSLRRDGMRYRLGHACRAEGKASTTIHSTTLSLGYAARGQARKRCFELGPM